MIRKGFAAVIAAVVLAGGAAVPAHAATLPHPHPAPKPSARDCVHLHNPRLIAACRVQRARTVTPALSGTSIPPRMPGQPQPAPMPTLPNL